MLSRLISALRLFRSDRRGSVGLLFALAAIPLLIAVGAVIDYARAAKVRDELTAICDASILAATTPAMMAQSSATAKAAAQALFAAEATTVNGLNYDPTKLTVSVNDAQNNGYVQRSASVTYQAVVQNAFGSLDMMPQTAFTVKSAVATSSAPNIDFYVLADNSPSMELPATTAGVTAMSAFGCAFACHENNVSDSDFKNNPYPGWGTVDSYTYAETHGIPLRIDNVRAAIQSVASNAQSTMTTNGANYRMAVYGFNYMLTQFQSLVPTTTANVQTLQSSVANLVPPLMDTNNNLAGNQTYIYQNGASTYASVNLNSSPVYIDDTMTDFTQAMTQINSAMPKPGNGTNANGDTPQGVLVIVTDGVVDVGLYSSSACNTSSTVPYSNSYGSFTRCHEPIDTAMCTTIKNRGIRIAVLYTTYQPVPSDGWYSSEVAPFISQVSPALQACASSPALFQEVTTDQDITAAMNALFQRAVSSAPHLTN